MNKLIVSTIAIIIILILILASYWWYLYCMSAARQDDVLYVMHANRFYLVIGFLSIIFFSVLTIVPVIFWDIQWFAAFATFYFFTLWSLYFCITILLWRCIIREDSLTFYMPLLPSRQIKFCEIDFVHYTDNHTYGMGGQKTLIGYRNQKKLFSIEEDVHGFPFLYTLLYELGKVDYIPVTESPQTAKAMKHIPAVESFTVAEKTGEKVRTVILFLFLAPCCMYVLWDWKEFEAIYLITAGIFLPSLIMDLVFKLVWKITVDFHSITIRNALGIVKTYEIRQITRVEELEHFIILYTGPKKIAKIAKRHKNFQYLFERLLRTEAEIYRKF